MDSTDHFEIQLNNEEGFASAAKFISVLTYYKLSDVYNFIGLPKPRIGLPHNEFEEYDLLILRNISCPVAVIC